MTDLFFKKRTHLGCLGASSDFLSANFASITRKTGLWILLFSVVNGMLSSIGTTLPIWPSFAFLVAGCCLLFAVDVKIKSIFISMTTHAKQKAMFTKILKVNLLAIFLFFAFGAIYAAVNYFCFAPKPSVTVMQNDATTPIFEMLATNGLLLLVMVFLMLPFCYSCTKFVLSDSMTFKEIFGKNYLFGLRKSGYLFVLVVIIALITLVALALLTFPYIIITISRHIDSLGVLSGDISGIPSYFWLLNFFSTAMMTLVMQYITMWFLLILCNACGSLDSK